jgi:hypothetical protein
VVEGARLERVYAGNRLEGSNPSLSAKIPWKVNAFGLDSGTNPRLHPPDRSAGGWSRTVGSRLRAPTALLGPLTPETGVRNPQRGAK